MQSSESTFERIALLFEGLTAEPRKVAQQALALMNGLYLPWLEDPSFDLMGEWNQAIRKILPENTGNG